jgi:hypothetical protein
LPELITVQDVIAGEVHQRNTVRSAAAVMEKEWEEFRTFANILFSQESLVHIQPSSGQKDVPQKHERVWPSVCFAARLSFHAVYAFFKHHKQGVLWWPFE